MWQGTTKRQHRPAARSGHKHRKHTDRVRDTENGHGGREGGKRVTGEPGRGRENNVRDERKDAGGEWQRGVERWKREREVE